MHIVNVVVGKASRGRRRGWWVWTGRGALGSAAYEVSVSVALVDVGVGDRSQMRQVQGRVNAGQRGEGALFGGAFSGGQFGGFVPARPFPVGASRALANSIGAGCLLFSCTAPTFFPRLQPQASAENGKNDGCTKKSTNTARPYLDNPPKDNDFQRKWRKRQSY